MWLMESPLLSKPSLVCRWVRLCLFVHLSAFVDQLIGVKCCYYIYFLMIHYIVTRMCTGMFLFV